MTLTITFDELVEIGNKITEEKVNDDRLEIRLHSLSDGICIHIVKFKWKIFTFRQKIELQILDYSDGILSSKIKIKNLVLDLFKKVLFLIVNRVMKKTDNDSDFRISDYLTITSNRLVVNINKLIEDKKLPFNLVSVNAVEGTVEIEGYINPEIFLDGGSNGEIEYTSTDELYKGELPESSFHKKL